MPSAVGGSRCSCCSHGGLLGRGDHQRRRHHGRGEHRDEQREAQGLPGNGQQGDAQPAQQSSQCSTSPSLRRTTRSDGGDDDRVVAGDSTPVPRAA